MEALPIAIGAGIAVLAIRSVMVRQRAIPIDPKHPLWIKSISRAQSTIDELRAIRAESALETLVKYAFTTSTGEREHVWGRLLELNDGSMRVTMETPPISHRGAAPGELTIPLTDLEDWQVSLPDGSIRGGFTTQAQIRMSRESGAPIPRHIAALEPRFADSL